MSVLDDPIYCLLVGAREKLSLDYIETLKNIASVRIQYGEEVHKELLTRLQTEHDSVKADLDLRINRRIVQLEMTE